MIKNGLQLLIFRGAGVILSYVLLAIIGTRCGADSLGLYALTTNAVNLAALIAALGIDQFILRTHQNVLITTGFWHQTANRIGPSVAVVACSLFLISWWSESTTSKNALAVGALFIPLVIAHSLVVEALVVTGRRTASEMIRSVLRPLCIIIGLWLIATPSVYAPLWWAAIVTLLLVIYGFWMLVISNKPQPSTVLQGHASFALITVGGFLLLNAASLIQEYRVGTEAVGTLNLAVRLGHLSAFGLVVSQAIFGPSIAQATNLGQAREVRRSAFKASVFSAVVALTTGVVLWFSRGILPQIFGVRLSDTTLGPIILGQMAYAASAGPFLALSMGGHSKSAAIALGAVASIQIISLSLTDLDPALIHGISFVLLAVTYAALAWRQTLSFTP